MRISPECGRRVSMAEATRDTANVDASGDQLARMRMPERVKADDADITAPLPRQAVWSSWLAIPGAKHQRVFGDTTHAESKGAFLQRQPVLAQLGDERCRDRDSSSTGSRLWRLETQSTDRCLLKATLDAEPVTLDIRPAQRQHLAATHSSGQAK